MTKQILLLEEGPLMNANKRLHMFDQSVMASAIFFAAVCYGSSFRARGTKKLYKLIGKAGSVPGTAL